MNFRKIWLKGGALFALDLQEPHAPQPSSSAQNPFLRQGWLSQSPVNSLTWGVLAKQKAAPAPASSVQGGMEPVLAELGLHCPDTQTCFALLLGQVPSAPMQREVCPADICLCSLLFPAPRAAPC